ncbi:MAG TPA: exosortase/archaeosortase family protein [archaeon]|nr:exosortase/archaeosortase family protein [archaeon]
MKKFSSRKKLLQVGQFFLVFNLLALPMYFVLLTDATFPPLQNFLAAITAHVLQFQKISATSSGSFVTIVDADNTLRNVQISLDSTGWKSLYALAALVVATPLPSWERKFRFLAVSLPAVFLLNFLRVWSTLWYSFVFGWENFDVVHTLLWREGLIAVVLLFWFFWLRDAVKLGKRSGV